MRTVVVVSGGDAPGINALIGQYVSQAVLQGDSVLGARGGFPGLLAGDLVPLTIEMLLPWAGRGGSVLPSSRDPVLSQDDAGDQLRAVLAANQIDYLLLFGGNGTLRHIPPRLREWDIPVIGIPTTIDNDVPGTELTLGFDSACNFAYHAIDGASATAHALHGRMFMVETLGGSCGNLALAVAEGAGAHAVILPEYQYNEDWLAARMKKMVDEQGYGLFVIGEGSRGARTLAEELPKLTGIRMRDVRLGHAQRGGVPSHRDRVLAVEMARLAQRSFREGVRYGVLVVQGGQMSLHSDPLPDGAIMPDKARYDRINGFTI
jgi:6-phosphofructokinase 1